MRVINEARTDYEYRFSSDYPIIKETIFSNKVITNIISEKLDSKKCTNKLFATLFDVLTYTIYLTNIGDIIVHNVYFQDLIQCSLEFVENSLTINGVNMFGKNPKEPIRVGDILPGETIIIQFKTIVINIKNLKCIKNYGTIYFDYVCDITKPPIKIEENTNTVITIVKNKLFKQFDLESIIEIPYCSRRVIDITKYKTKISIINYKVINTIINKIEDNKNRELCKIIIIGSIEYEIMYRYINKLGQYNNCSQNKLNYTSLRYVDGFSVSLLVPKGIESVEYIDIDIDIEDVMVKIVNNSICVSSNLLLSIK